MGSLGDTDGALGRRIGVSRQPALRHGGV